MYFDIFWLSVCQGSDPGGGRWGPLQEKKTLRVSPRGWAAWPSRCPSEPVPCTNCTKCVSDNFNFEHKNWPHRNPTRKQENCHAGLGFLSYYGRSTGFSLNFNLISPAFDSASFPRPWFVLFFQICPYLVMFSLITVPAALRLWIFDVVRILFLYFIILLLTISFLRSGMSMIPVFFHFRSSLVSEWLQKGTASLHLRLAPEEEVMFICFWSKQIRHTKVD